MGKLLPMQYFENNKGCSDERARSYGRWIYGSSDVIAMLNILSFDETVFLHKAKLMYKIVYKLAPDYLCEMFNMHSSFLQNTNTSMTLRSVTNMDIHVPRPKTETFQRKFVLLRCNNMERDSTTYSQYNKSRVLCKTMFNLDERSINIMFNFQLYGHHHHSFNTR